MHRTHDPAHQFLASHAGRPFCPVLYRAALGCTSDTPGESERHEIECRVLAFQRFAQTGEGRDEAVYRLTGVGLALRLDRLAYHFLKLMTGDAD